MDFLMHAGPLVWLVLLFGLVGLVGAVQYVSSSAEKQRALGVGGAVASTAVALLATITGFQKSVGGLGDLAADKRWIYLVGLEEGLNNVVLALVFVVLISLLLTAGAYRRGAYRRGAGA